MKLSSSIFLELDIAGIYYRKDHILIVIESSTILKHHKDTTKDVNEFLIKTNEKIISEDISDYEELVYFDNDPMDFYDYPILQALYNNYETFMENIIPCIIDYAKEYNLNFRESNEQPSRKDWVTCDLETAEDSVVNTKKSNKLFKFLNSGTRWLLDEGKK